MRKTIKELTLEQYREAISYGCGTLINYEGFALIHGTDAQDDCRYLVVKSLNDTAVDFGCDGSNMAVYELSIEDFHQLCTYYLIANQPGQDHAWTTFKDALQRLN